MGELIVRWGDQQSSGTVGTDKNFASGQLVKIHREIPESWTIQLWAGLVDQPPPANRTTDVSFLITLGCGSAVTTIQPVFVFSDSFTAPATEDYLFLNTPYLTAFRSFIIPAQDIQIQAFISNSQSPTSWVVAAYAAPRFNPQPQEGGDRLEPADGSHFIPPGFPAYDEGHGEEQPQFQPFGVPLRYRR